MAEYELHFELSQIDSELHDMLEDIAEHINSLLEDVGSVFGGDTETPDAVGVGG